MAFLANPLACSFDVHAPAMRGSRPGSRRACLSAGAGPAGAASLLAGAQYRRRQRDLPRLRVRQRTALGLDPGRADRRLRPAAAGQYRVRRSELGLGPASISARTRRAWTRCSTAENQFDEPRPVRIRRARRQADHDPGLGRFAQCTDLADRVFRAGRGTAGRDRRDHDRSFSPRGDGAEAWIIAAAAPAPTRSAGRCRRCSGDDASRDVVAGLRRNGWKGGVAPDGFVATKVRSTTHPASGVAFERPRVRLSRLIRGIARHGGRSQRGGPRYSSCVAGAAPAVSAPASSHGS